MRVLVIEDEEKIANFVKKGLEAQGCSVTLIDNGLDGLEQSASGLFDVVVLDIMLPGKDGLEILKELRENQQSVPVILLTARSEANQRVEGLNLGADDYITKPFFMDELMARINAVGRRTTILHAGPLSINVATREVRYDNEKIDFAPREFSLLEHLMRSRGTVFTRDQLLEKVWGYGFDPQTNLVDVCIRRIRLKIDRHGHQFIETVRYVGYRFNKEEL